MTNVAGFKLSEGRVVKELRKKTPLVWNFATLL
jgi:hypothetical protein